MSMRDMILQNHASKPERVPLTKDNTPFEMQEARRWITWGYEWRGKADGSGKWQKVPRGKWTESDNWLTFDAASAKLDSDKTVDGIGFVLGDGWIGVDIDDCVNPISGEITPVAESIVRKLGSYAEKSPTKTGVKIILRGKCNTAFCEELHIEVYGSGRYFTFTSDRIGIGGESVKKDSGGMEWLVDTYFPKKHDDTLGAKEEFPLEVVAEALMHVPSCIAEEYSEWIAVGHAAKAAGEEMFEHWVEWSSKADNFGGEDQCRAKWDSMSPSRTGPRKIFSLARMGGWSPPGKPEVHLGIDLTEVAEKALVNVARIGVDAAWITESDGQKFQMYRRNGDAVGLSFLKGLPKVVKLNRGQIFKRINLANRFIRKTKDGYDPCTPPKELRDTIADLAIDDYSPIRDLTSVITAPTIRPDGTILQQAGWDKQTGIYFHRMIPYPQVPVKPSASEVQRATDRLMHVIKDFPLKDRKTDRASWLAMLLTLIGRPCFTGCCPMFVVSGNVPGCGKGLFIDSASMIAFGDHAPKREYVTREEEMGKVVLAAILEGTPAICFDNVRGRIGGQTIEATLTAPKFSGRELGASKYHSGLQNNVIWLATGNNLGFRGDFARRAIPIRLESPLDKPHKRTDVEHTDLLGWVKENRADLVMAALTILRGFFEAGKPRTDKRAMASFENWSTTIRDAVVWTGIGDPLDSEKYAEQEDESCDILAALIEGLKEIFAQRSELESSGVTAKQMIAIADEDFDGESYPYLVSALESLDRRSPVGLGMKVAQFIDRPWRGFKIVKSKMNKGYRLESTSTPDISEIW